MASLTSLLGAGSKAAMISVRQLILSLLALLTASGVLAVFLTNPEFVGSQAVSYTHLTLPTICSV